jgi:hypothetical protein
MVLQFVGEYVAALLSAGKLFFKSSSEMMEIFLVEKVLCGCD